MVSKAREDLPDPDRPVITTSRWRGMSTSMFLRLWTLTPRTAIQSCDMALCPLFSERLKHRSYTRPVVSFAPDEYKRRTSQAFRRLLGPDVRLARLDHRIGLAARR